MAFGSSAAHIRMLEEAEAIGMLGKSGCAEDGAAVGRGMIAVQKSSSLSVGVPLSGSPTASSNPWNSSESCYGGSTPPSLFSDSSFAETESSEDDDFMAGLAEQMAHSMLDDSDDNIGSSVSEVDSVDRAGIWGDNWNPVQQLKGSPVAETEQLLGRKSNWSTGCWSSGYSSSSSKVSSQVSSPPSTPGAFDDGWDSVAASDFNRYHIDEKGALPLRHGSVSHLPEVHWKNGAFQDSPSLSRSSAVSGALPILTKPYATAVNPQRGWTQREEDRRPSSQCRSSKQPPVQGAWNRHNRLHPQPQQQPCVTGTSRSSYRSAVTQRPMAQPWQTIPPANGSVMRAVFLGGSSDRSSCGTGVFLPRSSNDYSKRKTSCSSVLLPSRIVQVLNLNIDDMRCHPSAHSGAGTGPAIPAVNAAAGMEAGASSFGDDMWPSSQWKTYTTCSQLHQPSESTLPTEWSY